MLRSMQRKTILILRRSNERINRFITKKFSVLLITAITAVSLVSCGKTTKPEASSDSEVSSVINVKASAWDSLNDAQQAYYKGLEDIC